MSSSSSPPRRRPPDPRAALADGRPGARRRLVGGVAPAPEELAYAGVWRAADKVVYSRTLDAVSTPRTRLEREFDAEAVRRMKEDSDRELAIGGPGLAEHAQCYTLSELYSPV